MALQTGSAGRFGTFEKRMVGAIFARMFGASSWRLDFRAGLVLLGVQGLWRRMLHSHSPERPRPNLGLSA